MKRMFSNTSILKKYPELPYKNTRKNQAVIIKALQINGFTQEEVRGLIWYYDTGRMPTNLAYLFSQLDLDIWQEDIKQFWNIDTSEFLKKKWFTLHALKQACKIANEIRRDKDV